ncbi:20695_t:CDS:2, partial [Racocetra persica]
ADDIVKDVIDDPDLEEAFAGTYIRVTGHNDRVAVYTVDFHQVPNVFNDPRIIPIHNLIAFVPTVNHLSLPGLQDRQRSLRRIADEHNPMFVTIFIDVRLNNNVVALYHEYENQNREFIQAIVEEPELQHPLPIFEPIPALAGDGFTNLAEDVTCSLGFWAKREETEENVFVSSGRCYRFDHDYYLKPWALQNLPLPDVRNHIGQMDRRRGHNDIDFSILRVVGDVEPTAFVKNVDSPDFTELPHSALFFDGIDPYRVKYVIDMDSNIGDLGGPVYHHYERARVSVYGIISGNIGDITLSTDVDLILEQAHVQFVNYLGE